MDRQVHVLGFSGSLRKASFNTGLIRAASQLMPERMTLEEFDLSSIPLYNADNDGPHAPGSVLAFKSRIAAADALLIATPEYNYSIPGVLKNAIDWASRTPTDSPLREKPVGMMGAGGVMGTVRAQTHLRQILHFNGAFALLKPEVYVSRAREKFDDEGRLTDDDTMKQIRAFLDALYAWVLRLNPTRQAGPGKENSFTTS